MTERLGPLAGRGQHAVAEPQQVPGDAGLGVGEERQHVDLRVPEVVAVVGTAGQPLGRDAGALGPPGCLAQLEQVPADGLLHANRVEGGLDDHVGPFPEPVEVAPLGGHRASNPSRDGTVEGAFATGDEIGWRGHPRRVEREVLDDADGLPASASTVMVASASSGP